MSEEPLAAEPSLNMRTGLTPICASPTLPIHMAFLTCLMVPLITASSARLPASSLSAPNRTTGTRTAGGHAQQRAPSLHEETQLHSTWLIWNTWERLLGCYNNWSRKGLGAPPPPPYSSLFFFFFFCRKYDFITGMQTCLLHLSFLLICCLFLHVIALINLFIEVIYNVVLISAVQNVIQLYTCSVSQ